MFAFKYDMVSEQSPDKDKPFVFSSNRNAFKLIISVSIKLCLAKLCASKKAPIKTNHPINYFFSHLIFMRMGKAMVG